MVRSFSQLLTIAWFGAINAGRWSQFDVFWNAPTKQCRNWTSLERPESYGILANDGYEFRGDIIVIFYEEMLGLYPYYRNFSDPSSAVNGGIPQRANLTAHLKKVREDIEKAIPNSSFNGLAIIDYEKWRPLWKQNWYTKQIYQKESLAYVRGRCSNKSSRCKSVAINEFNSASMKFLVETIREAKKTRPNALWGYYGMPFCNYTAGKNGTIACGEVYNEFNDRLLSLYNESTALYPSIYLHNPQDSAANCRYIISVLQETKRLAEKLQLPIFTYTGFEYFPLEINPYYTEQDLLNSLRKAFEMRVNGAIIWTTSNGMSERCQGIGDYVYKHLGPEVSRIKEFIKNSSEVEMTRCPEHHKYSCEEQNYHCYEKNWTKTPPTIDVKLSKT